MANAVAQPPALQPAASQLPAKRLSLRQLLNLSAGIIGLQFAWSMQIALSSRVLEPLGADPFLFGLIWCAGPITGLLIQPVVGAISDNTWTRLGRRRPFILAGALLGAAALLWFPYSTTLLGAALLTWVIDACLNTAQGPYRALVPDTAPPEQHAIANAYISFAFGVGSVVALGTAPLLNALGVEMSVTQQYILSAIALVLTITYASLTIRETRPKAPAAPLPSSPIRSDGIAAAVRRFVAGNREIHKLCGVQFLTWVGLMCMYIYLTPYVVHHVYQLPDFSSPAYKRLELAVRPVDSVLGKLFTKRDGVSPTQALTVASPQQEADWDRLLLTYVGAPKGLPPVLDASNAKAWPANKRLRYKKALLQAPSMSEQSVLKPIDQIEPQGLAAQMAHFHYLKAREQAATQTAQLSLVAYNLMTLLLTIPLGYLASRWGKKPLYGLTLVIYAAAVAFAPWVQTPGQVMIMMAVAGIGGATILSLPFAMLCEYLPEGDEGSVLGIFNVFVCAPQLISALVIGKLIGMTPQLTVLGQTHQWSIAFVTAAVFVLLSAVALMGFKERYPGSGNPPAAVQVIRA